MIYDCIIVGAGAAGLFCSAVFPTKVNGLILEKNKQAGTKLMMSGAGQCNITHAGSIKDFIPKYGKNGSSVRSCLYRYHNLHLINFLHAQGIPTVEREDGKVFPASMDAQAVRDMLLHQSKQNGFSIQYHAPVVKISKEQYWQVHTAKAVYPCKNLVIATGGCSYPSTGSDGNFFPILQHSLGLAVTALLPALTPINVAHYPYQNLAGISFPSAELKVLRDDKPKIKSTGPVLLTHKNFSGPLMLNFSKEIIKNDKIMLNYLYPCEKNEVLEKIIFAMKNSKKQPANLLADTFHLPKSFLQTILQKTGFQPKAIAARLTEDTFTVTSRCGFDKAMVTAGGVSLSEINKKTMECISAASLYIIGEALDLDGQTGGYNLQFAYSSACAASTAICEKF